jgi:hypothetical protein
MRALFLKGSRTKLISWSRLVGLLTWSDYVHVELQLSNGLCITASLKENRVVIRYLDINEDDYYPVEIPCTAEQEEMIYEKAMRIAYGGAEYDVDGIIHFLLFLWQQRPDKWFCSELIVYLLMFAGVLTFKQIQLTVKDLYRELIKLLGQSG